MTATAEARPARSSTAAAGDPGAGSGCVSVNREPARRIVRNPQNHYFNVHTPSFPGGAVRGPVKTARF